MADSREPEYVLERKDEFDAAMELLTKAHTPEEVQKAQSRVQTTRAEYMAVSKQFQQELKRNSELARMRRQGVEPSFDRTTQQLTNPPPRDHPRAPGNKLSLSNLSDEYKVWGCPECGNMNVNWLMLGGRKKQRVYVKRHKLDTKLMHEGRLRYCIRCTQVLKRDILLKKLSLDDLLHIKTDYEEKRVEKKKQIP